MTFPPNQFAYSTYLVVGAIAFVAGAVGGVYWFIKVIPPHEWPPWHIGILFGMCSSCTWVLIVRLLAPRSWFSAVLIGLLSPFLASVFLLPFAGLGIFAALAVALTYPIVAPIGVATALGIYPLLKPKRRVKGFDVIMPPNDRDIWK